MFRSSLCNVQSWPNVYIYSCSTIHKLPGIEFVVSGFPKTPLHHSQMFRLPPCWRSASLAEPPLLPRQLGLTEVPVVSLLGRCQKMATCRYLHHVEEVSDCRLDTSVEFRDCAASGRENTLETNKVGFWALAPHYGVQTLVHILGSPHCAPLGEVHMGQTSVHVLDVFCHFG